MKHAKKAVALLAALPLLFFGLLIAIVVLIVAAPPSVVGCGSPADGAARGVIANLPEEVAGYSGEQLQNAAQIMLAAKDMGLSLRAQQIGVMTAIGESSLVVLDNGDAVGPDSRGLFQQRDNGAWGSYADRMDPYISATNFYKALVQVPGWETMAPTLAAHATQHNADPYHYEKSWDDAVAIVDALSGAVSSPATVAPVAQQPSGDGHAPVENTAGELKPGVQEAIDAVYFGVPGIQSIGGTRASAVDPNGHPSGRAADFMVTGDPATGDAIVAFVISHWDQLGVEYMIWQQRILMGPTAAWEPMEDRGSPTQNHMDHVHVNFTGTGTGVTGGGTPCPAGGGVPAGAGGWVKPATGTLSSGFSPARVNPVTGVTESHNGQDIAAACGTPIYVAADGDVIKAGVSSGFGHAIFVDHGDGIVTWYGHEYADGIMVAVGDHVTAGQQIGEVGSDGQSTGCHLHVEVHVDGKPVDPVPFFAEKGASLG